MVLEIGNLSLYAHIGEYGIAVDDPFDIFVELSDGQGSLFFRRTAPQFL